MSRHEEGEPAELRARSGRSDLLVSLLLPAFVMTLAIWLSTGTMAPIAASLDTPLVMEPCHYLANVDHGHHLATFALLDRHPSAEWRGSVELRRILYPIVAYPLMKLIAATTGDLEAGFLLGGILTTILMHIAALRVFVDFVRRRYGRVSSIVAAWLLATYPGITYWAGMPYSYAAIVPLSLLAVILLFYIDEDQSLNALIAHSFLLGLLFTGYDLLPYFGTASILLVLRKRSPLRSVVNAGCLVLPVVVVGALLRLLPDLPFSNENTEIYKTIVLAYLELKTKGWGALLLQLPGVALSNFFFSNFVILPAAWLYSLAIPGQGQRRLERAETATLIAIAAVFLFNNAAPPYSGWQLRGVWIARLYQPVFVVFVLGLARWCTTEGWRRPTIAVIVLLNATTAFGPMMMSTVAMNLDWRFYRHATPSAMHRNLLRYGRRPLGVCSEDPGLDVVVPASAQRPRYMYVPEALP
ncbi:MAG TPA: hypothetical protein VHL58_12450 [Thermoanaerobaculia bacterium]|nr:hypothetical protein [Thermoanaerobaculia bacterium]